MPDEFVSDVPTSYVESKYDREHFYVQSTDSKGHSQKVRMSVPPEVKGRIGALIASKAIPIYRTEMDFHRDAEVHRLHDVSEMLKTGAPVFSGELEVLSKTLIAESSLYQLQELAAADQRLFDTAMKLLDTQGYAGTREAVERIVDIIQNPSYREQIKWKLK